MRPISITMTPANTDTDGLADNNDSSGSSLTLDGALTSGGTFTSADGLGRRVQITDTATVDQSGATFTVTGTDVQGNAISEAITGPGSGATVTSTYYFYTISSVAIASGAACGTVDMGTADEAVSAWKPLDWRQLPFEVSIAANISGTINYGVQHTLDNILADGAVETSVFSLDHSDFQSKTVDYDGNYDFPVSAIRMVINSFTNGATVSATVLQA